MSTTRASLPIAVSAAAVLTGAVLAYRKYSSKSTNDSPTRHRKHWQDHPLAAWAIENSAIVSAALIANRITLRETDSPIASFLRRTIRGIALLESITLAQYIVVHHVYSHIPYMNEKKRQVPPIRKVLADWCSTNLVVTLAAAVVEVLSTSSSKEGSGSPPTPTPELGVSSVSAFLGKLIVSKALSEIAFFSIHWTLHKVPILYKWIHKRHHEVHHCSLAANYHFTVTDLTLEGFLPVVVATEILLAAGFKISIVEEMILASYYYWYEVGSHSGKIVPAFTLIPPIAPLYSMFCDIDKDHAAHHELHHNNPVCNFGTSPLVESILGTAKRPEKNE